MSRWTLQWTGIVVVGIVPLARAQQPAQSPAARVDVWVLSGHLKTRVFDANTPVASSPLQTAAVRVLRHGSVHRIELAPDLGTPAWGVSSLTPPGFAYLVSTADAGTSVVAVDTIKRQYTPIDVRRGVPDMWQPVRFHPPADSAAPGALHDSATHVLGISVTVDSVGPGPVTHGHPTVRYRQTERAAVQTDYGPLYQITTRTEGTDEVDIATNIPNAPPIDGLGLERLTEFSLGTAMTPVLAPALRAAAAKYPRGVILHIEGRHVMGSPGGATTRLTAIDIDHWGPEAVDASLFAVPSTYTRGEVALPGP